MNRSELEKIREGVRFCRNQTNPGCEALLDYREGLALKKANHPLLFQIVQDPKIMIIGAVPGGLDSSGKLNYQELVNGQFSLGHKSAQGLGEIMKRTARLCDIKISHGIAELPTSRAVQNIHLECRNKMSLHVTNLVRCNAPTGWEKAETNLWSKAAHDCYAIHLSREVQAVNPIMIILLGMELARFLSKKEGWGRERMPITKWATNAGPLPFFGNEVFVTGWSHPGGRYFWIKGRKLWDLYADQMAKFI